MLSSLKEVSFLLVAEKIGKLSMSNDAFLQPERLVVGQLGIKLLEISLFLSL